jgi:DNA-binding response OmpR family regulator
MFDRDMTLSLRQETVSPLNVLLVEDEKSQAMLVQALLAQYGHTVHVAASGEQGVEMYGQIKPDLVLMDVILPGINGYEATRQIRAAHEEWTPIIFLTGQTSKADRLYALRVGGDDFFTKPVDPVVLVAKMNVMSRIHKMQALLRQYVTTHEAEDELAAYVIGRYLAASQNDPRVEYSILSASHHFSGDVISVAKTPDGGLNIMMVDATGHGLPAAISALPAIQAFFSMSKKGIPLQGLVREINDKVRELFPTGRFLAGTFLHLNAHNSELTGWIGGTPKIYLDSDGEVISFSSKNLPLGIRPSDKLEPEFFSAPWSDKSLLVTCTDGVLESVGADGAELGEEWIRRVIKLYGNALDKAVFDRVWQESLAGNKPHDDASVLIVRGQKAEG